MKHKNGNKNKSTKKRKRLKKEPLLDVLTPNTVRNKFVKSDRHIETLIGFMKESVIHKEKYSLIVHPFAYVIVSPDYILKRYNELNGDYKLDKYQLIDYIISMISFIREFNPKTSITMDMGKVVGFDNLIPIYKASEFGEIRKESIKGFDIPVIHTNKPFPKTSQLNVSLSEYDSKHDKGHIYKTFEHLPLRQNRVFVVVRFFSGTFAPDFYDKQFWDNHVLLKKL